MDHLKVRGNMYYEEAMHRFQIFYQSKYLLIRFFQEHFQISLCMSVFCLATKELHFSVIFDQSLSFRRNNNES